MTANHGAGVLASIVGRGWSMSALLGIAGGSAAALPAHGGQVEEFMSFQARLTDNLGNPLQDGTHTLDFFIYDAASGGAIIGVVLDVEVQTSSGTGIVSTSIGPMDKGWFDEAPRFLALTIDDNDDDPAGDELSPRIRLTSVPFAFRAFNLQPNAIVNVQGVTSGVVESSLNFDTANASSGTGVTAMTIDKDGRVGIGTMTPTTPLHVSRPGLDDDVAMTLQNGAVDWRVGVQGAIGDRFAITANGSADNPLVIDRGAGGGAQNDALRILANGAVSMKGNVGIGTSSPAQKLSVAGVIQSTSGGIMFPDGTVQATAQLVGPMGLQGPKGDPGPPGETVVVTSVAVCGNLGPGCGPSECATMCGGASHVVGATCAPCMISSDTGFCIADGSRGSDSCCVCKP